MMMGQTVRTTYLALAGLYLLVMIWVWGGIFYYTGLEYADLAAILAASFAVTAAVFYFVGLPLLRPLAELDIAVSPRLITGLAIGAISVLVLLHWMVLGRIPILAAYRTTDYLETSLIRESIQHTGVPLVGYIPTVVVKSTVPFLAIYLISVKRYALSWFVMLVGLAYGMSLMQKSYPLFMLVPPFIYCVLTRRIARASVVIALAVMAVAVALFAANPALRPSLFNRLTQEWLPAPTHEKPSSAPQATQPERPQSSRPQPPARNSESAPTADAPVPSYSMTEKIERSLQGITRRVLFVPGSVVAKWFRVFPSVFPYEYGCGYRFLSPLVGCTFKPNALIVYAHYYPERVEKGLQGSMNASHFAEEYANFGPPGLLLSGFLIAGVLAAAALASARAGLAAAVSVNFPFIMAISSTALHTTLLSGGWGLTLLLTVMFYSLRPREYASVLPGHNGRSDFPSAAT